jgi:hypothetical protein
MKSILFLSALCGVLLFSSCKKTSPSTSPKFTWTYSGATYTADTVLASTSFVMNGIVNSAEIYAQNGPWATPTTAFTMKISSLATGNYGVGNDEFDEYLSATGNNQITPFSATITSSSSSQVSGTFSGTLNGQTITGTFSNVPIVP